MTPVESRVGAEDAAAAVVCSRCAAKIMPYFSDNAVASHNQINQLISENFLTVKGAALFLPCGNGSSPSSVPRIPQRRDKHTGDLQLHLQTMFTLLRPEDTIRLAVRLESAYSQCTRYMVVVSTCGRQDTEESVVLGIDFTSSDRQCTVGLVLPLWSDTRIHLDGDGGFSVSTVSRVHIFKPVSVQAMWSSLQSLHKACEVARCHNYYPGSLFLTWVSYYQTRISSEQHCINEWNAMRDVQSHRSDSPVLFTAVPTERERTEMLIKTRLREIMMQKDLENVTSKEIRSELEMQMVCNLREFKEFIDNEMIVILGQMDSPTEIFDHVFLGSEWNASNLEELQSSGVRYILNVTREIDNFFPGMFEYHNIRVYDEEATNLLEYWNDTYKFISKAKKAGVKCLVHCKMGVSRSASTVIAYAMKEYGWDLDRAYDHVKERRTVTKPNPSFMKQLEEYQGILLASKQRHNKLWRSHSDSDLSEQQDPASACRTSRTLSRSDPHNQPHRPTTSRPISSVLHMFSSSQTASDHTPTGNTVHPEEPCEDPQLAALPRPRAATVVPEQNLTESVTLKVAVAVPVARPQPPPSLYQQSPSSEPEPDGPQEPAQRDCPSLDNYENSDTLGIPTPLSSSEGPPELSLCGNDAESCNDGESHRKSDSSAHSRSSSLSTESIDFSSARQKFLDLSQDALVVSRSPSPCLEERTPVGATESSAADPSSMSCSAPPSTEPRPLLTENPTPNLESESRVQPSSLGSQPLPEFEEQQVRTVESSSFSSSPPCEPKVAPTQEHFLISSSDAEAAELCSPPEGTQADEHEEESRPLDDDDSGIIPDPSVCTVTVTPSLDPSSSSSSSLLWLESDGEDATARTHDLQRIQETLRELQAFLCEAGGMEAGFSCRQRPSNAHLRAPPTWQRAVEMEARIRQAGLTPPSLMKRSASLAKLDQLELSAHDLNDWDFRSELTPSSSTSWSLPQSLTHSLSHSLTHSLSSSHDEAHKKQRVLPQDPAEGSPLHGTGTATDALAPPTRPQPQHTKPLRRLRKTSDKKKTVTVLYNTM